MLSVFDITLTCKNYTVSSLSQQIARASSPISVVEVEISTVTVERIRVNAKHNVSIFFFIINSPRVIF